MKGKYIDTIRLAIPATLYNILQASIGIMDAYIVASLGVVIVSSVSLSNSIIAIYLAIFLALSVETCRCLNASKEQIGKI